MKATLFEFRYRWWIIASLFAVAFLAYAVDPMNSGTAATNWLAKRMGNPATDNMFRVIFGAGALLLLLAAFLRTWGTSYLQVSVMHDSCVHTEKLLADGPYRYVRNPLYLGNILMSVAMGLMASRLGFLVLSLGMTIFVLRLLLREESELLRDRGEPYRGYCNAVPRLIPSFTPQVASTGDAPHWRQGFRAELMYWLMAAALAAFAITLNIKIFWGIFAFAFASSWLYKRPEIKQG